MFQPRDFQFGYFNCPHHFSAFPLSMSSGQGKFSLFTYSASQGCRMAMEGKWGQHPSSWSSQVTPSGLEESEQKQHHGALCSPGLDFSRLRTAFHVCCLDFSFSQREKSVPTLLSLRKGWFRQFLPSRFLFCPFYFYYRKPKPLQVFLRSCEGYFCAWGEKTTEGSILLGSFWYALFKKVRMTYKFVLLSNLDIEASFCSRL